MRNVVILGMHRSGTSMVAGELVAAGLYAGAAEELLDAQEDNPVGFWERQDVVALNDQMLETAGGSWFSPRPLRCSQRRNTRQRQPPSWRNSPAASPGC
ncbi:hypothetical protein [Kineobactrum salinum]|uniref:Sulfotransferase family protein n=1 Tax=Kineobactrum salinum TaxID=2708301 RepID=A0A6C0U7B7_9GAMM|nr:hypothetical protein [Kineobactrum salinum]QIB66325.1 hypothetical protein G3T16_13825 [Kineobactrum salinum]